MKITKLVKIRMTLKTLQLLIEEIIDEECKELHKIEDKNNKKMVA